MSHVDYDKTLQYFGDEKDESMHKMLKIEKPFMVKHLQNETIIDCDANNNDCMVVTKNGKCIYLIGKHKYMYIVSSTVIYCTVEIANKYF